MFQSLLKRAEATVDNVVAGLVVKAIVAIPFLIAFGFVTAAATLYVNRAFGPEAGYLIMTAAFLVLGAFGAMLAGSRAPSASDQVAEPAQAADESGSSTEPDLANADRELMTAALTAIGPVAAPALVRLAVRNLPLIVAVAAAGFVLTRSPQETRPGGLGLEPAE